MKRLIILATVALMTFGATVVFAQGRGMGYGNGMGNGGGAGWHHGNGHGYGCGGNCFQQGDNTNGGFGFGGAGMADVTEDEAIAKVQEHIDNSGLKGYTITGTSPFTNPRGFECYIVKVTDGGGNNFVFMVGARGFVRGPMLENNFNAWQQNAAPAK